MQENDEVGPKLRRGQRVEFDGDAFRPDDAGEWAMLTQPTRLTDQAGDTWLVRDRAPVIPVNTEKKGKDIQHIPAAGCSLWSSAFVVRLADLTRDPDQAGAAALTLWATYMAMA